MKNLIANNDTTALALFKKLFSIPIQENMVIVDDVMFSQIKDIIKNDIQSIFEDLSDKIFNGKLVSRKIKFIYNRMIFTFLIFERDAIDFDRVKSKNPLIGVLKIIPDAYNQFGDDVAIYVPIYLASENNPAMSDYYCSFADVSDHNKEEKISNVASVGIGTFAAFESQFNNLNS